MSIVSSQVYHPRPRLRVPLGGRFGGHGAPPAPLPPAHSPAPLPSFVLILETLSSSPRFSHRMAHHPLPHGTLPVEGTCCAHGGFAGGFCSRGGRVPHLHPAGSGHAVWPPVPPAFTCSGSQRRLRSASPRASPSRGLGAFQAFCKVPLGSSGAVTVRARSCRAGPSVPRWAVELPASCCLPVLLLGWE